MKTTLSFGIILGLTLLAFSPASAQGVTAVPFLRISSSVEGNGMGGISASVPTDNAMSVIANPGQLGLLSIKSFLTAGVYTEKTLWLPQFNQEDLTYNTSAVNAGINLNRLTFLPLPVSLGVGYSRIFLNLGTFARVSSVAPESIRYFQSNEKCEDFSIAVGFDYPVRVGLGLSYKSIESNLSSIGTEQEEGTGSAKASAVDYGVIVTAPITEMISSALVEPLELCPKAAPLLDVTVGYARSNLGDEVTYVDPGQRDPLPRNATLGLSIELGIVSRALSSDWKILSLTWAREVEDLLVKRFSGGGFEYRGWFGDIKPFDNLILGKWGGNVELRKGWQLEVGEIVSVRGGSYTGTGSLMYETSGYSIRLSGFLKLIEAMNRSAVSGTWLGFVKDHFDLQYHSSSYGESTSPVSGTSFKGVNLVIR